jgi:hypothetical protein
MRTNLALTLLFFLLRLRLQMVHRRQRSMLSERCPKQSAIISPE